MISYNNNDQEIVEAESELLVDTLIQFEILLVDENGDFSTYKQFISFYNDSETADSAVDENIGENEDFGDENDDGLNIDCIRVYFDEEDSFASTITYQIGAASPLQYALP